MEDKNEQLLADLNLTITELKTRVKDDLNRLLITQGEQINDEEYEPSNAALYKVCEDINSMYSNLEELGVFLSEFTSTVQ
jgi:hypothetical protein